MPMEPAYLKTGTAPPNRINLINLVRIEQRRGQLARNLNAIASLAASLLALGIIWIASMFFEMAGQESRQAMLELSLKQAAQEIETLQPRVDQLQKDVDALAAHLLPNLIPIRMGQPIAIETRFASNITFEPTEARNGKGLHYRLVAQNTDRFAVYLKVDLLFFDSKGMQIGVSRIGTGHTGSTAPVLLQRGELKVVSAPVEITAGHADYPDIRYFKLWFPE